VVLIVKPVFEELFGCILSRGRTTQGGFVEEARVAFLLFPRIVLRPMADFTAAGHLPHVTVADNRDNRLARWAPRDLDALFTAARAHASFGTGRAPPLTSLPSDGTDSISFRQGISVKIVDHAACLAAVGECRRAIMEAVNSSPIASGH
jgi:hypothetical protein